MAIRTASSLNTFMDCPRKYEYSYERLYRSVKPIPAFLIGSVVHKGLEAYWLRKSWEEARTMMEEEKKREHPDYWETDAGKLESLKCEAYIKGYYAKWLTRDLSTYDVVGVEHEFVIGQNAGKLDVLLRRKADKQLVIMEHKTAGPWSGADEPSSPYWLKLVMDTQVVWYTHNISKEFKEDPIFIYDVVIKTSGKPKKSRSRQRKNESAMDFARRKSGEDESPAQYRERLSKAYCTEPERFVRREVVLTKQDREIKLRELDSVIKAIKPPFLRNTTSCVRAGGACPFLEVCIGADTLSGQNFTAKQRAHSELTLVS